MTEGWTRFALVVLSLAAIAAFLYATAVWVISPCENVDRETLDTVRCDMERGREWVIVQTVLVLVGAAALLGGIAWALGRPSFAPLVAGAGIAALLYVVVFMIETIDVGDEPLPRLSNVRLVDRGCTFPCSSGIRVAFTIDRDAEVDFHLGPARFEAIGGRQYGSGRLGGDYSLRADPPEFEAGSHEARVGGEIRNPPAERGPLPPGDYELEVIARARDAGNQERQTGGAARFPVVIRPAGR